MRKNKLFAKRLLAYLIDILIVTTISSIITMTLPNSSKLAKNYNTELNELLKDYKNEVISQSVYEENYLNINYDYSLKTVQSSIITVALTLLYFVIFAYYNDGQTIGKKLMKLRIVSNDKRKLKVNNLLFRSLIVNSILNNLISITLLLTVNKETYLKVDEKISIVFSIIYVLTMLLMATRENERGLQDYIGNTKVISTIEKVEEDIKEAEIIKEKDSYIEEIKKDHVESFEDRKKD